MPFSSFCSHLSYFETVPICEFAAERPHNSNELLLNVGFLRRCSETLSVPMRPMDVFSKKHLNIVDPLNDRNNLGRSVSQGI